MRRSFGGGGGGRNMGGGGGVIRSVQRAVRAGVGGASPEPFSSSTTTIASAKSKKAKTINNKQPTSPNTALTLSSGPSAFSSMVNLPASGAAAPYCVDESEWEYVDEREVERVARGFYEDYVFGTVPSKDEVHHAVSALQQVLAPSSCICSPKVKLPENTDKDVADEVANSIGFEKRISSMESEMDWVEPSPHLCHSKMLQLHGSDRVYDAFHLLETEPSVQRMVISLSSDKAVWDAVLSNEVVKELRGSICQKADSLIEENSDEGPDDSNAVTDILSWIIVNGKAKIMQLIDKITKLVNEAFQAPNEEKIRDSTDPFQDKLKSSLLLSVVVLLIVVVTRTKTA